MANYMGLRYYAYSSDRINLIAWQFNDQLVSIIASRLTASTMAQFARQGIGDIEKLTAPN